MKNKFLAFFLLISLGFYACNNSSLYQQYTFIDVVNIRSIHGVTFPAVGDIPPVGKNAHTVSDSRQIKRYGVIKSRCCLFESILSDQAANTGC